MSEKRPAEPEAETEAEVQDEVTAELRRRLAQGSEVRLDKVEEVTRAIATGRYRVDPTAIAGRMLERDEVD